MYEFKNLPNKNSKYGIVGRVPETEQEDFIITDTEDWVICRVSRATLKSTADDIADAIKFARDRGYNQAFEDMRTFFGIKQ